MELTVGDVCALLNVTEKELIRWIKLKKIPAHKIHHRFFFNKAEVHEWIINNNWKATEKILGLALTKMPVSLYSLLNKGGIFYKISGVDVPSVIKNAVGKMTLPAGLSKDSLISALLDRERMVPTAIGKGISIPHPRNPIVSDVENESVSLYFLKEAVDFGALDKKPVRALFIVLCANAKRHLEILSRISYLCQDNDFIELIEKQSEAFAILKYIEKKEIEWVKG